MAVPLFMEAKGAVARSATPVPRQTLAKSPQMGGHWSALRTPPHCSISTRSPSATSSNLARELSARRDACTWTREGELARVEEGVSVGRSVMESTRCGNQIVLPAHDDAYAHDDAPAHDDADGDVTTEGVPDTAPTPETAPAPDTAPVSDTAPAPETAPSTRGALSTASPIGYRG